MLPRRALPAARQSLAHSFPICEMGSYINILRGQVKRGACRGTRASVVGRLKARPLLRIRYGCQTPWHRADMESAGAEQHKRETGR